MPSDADDVLVSVATLDRLLADSRRVDVIKIDAEGYELAVLRGAAEVLRNCRPRLVVVEVQEATLKEQSATPSDVYELLEEYGYAGDYYESPYHAPMVAFRLTHS
jgi:hypothetical protein